MQVILLHQIDALSTSIFKSRFGFHDDDLVKVLGQHFGKGETAIRATAHDHAARIFGFGGFAEVLEVWETGGLVDDDVVELPCSGPGQEEGGGDADA